MVTDLEINHEFIERLSTWRGTALFQARDARDSREVVVRLFETNPKQTRDAVLTAAQRALSVSHPVIDMALPEPDHGSLVMVSDTCPGELLERRLQRGALPLGQAIDLLRHLTAGVAALHRAGQTHGGVHPANVWLAERGSVHLLGLGLADADSRPLAELAAHAVQNRIGFLLLIVAIVALTFGRAERREKLLS